MLDVDDFREGAELGGGAGEEERELFEVGGEELGVGEGMD